MSQFSFLDDDELLNVGPAYQPRIYVIMRVSPRLGGTYSEIRKSIQGVKKLLDQWLYLGIDMNNVRVYPITKAWIPQRKSNEKSKLKLKEVVRT